MVKNTTVWFIIVYFHFPLYNSHNQTGKNIDIHWNMKCLTPTIRALHKNNQPLIPPLENLLSEISGILRVRIQYIDRALRIQILRRYVDQGTRRTNSRRIYQGCISLPCHCDPIIKYQATNSIRPTTRSGSTHITWVIHGIQVIWEEHTNSNSFLVYIGQDCWYWDVSTASEIASRWVGILQTPTHVKCLIVRLVLPNPN